MKFLARWRHRVPARNSKRRAAPLGFLTKRYFEKRDPTLKILAYEIKKPQAVIEQTRADHHYPTIFRNFFGTLRPPAAYRGNF
ncbi:unnamed protein product [Oikopleura dioica]|uniref:Uncharacterized protein n=1 Tax=Oikopleura dioica TaxID=34765 RepID=E4X598_OIKDI|nr:unnamed protein product [Oikopleura dioica]